MRSPCRPARPRRDRAVHRPHGARTVTGVHASSIRLVFEAGARILRQGAFLRQSPRSRILDAGEFGGLGEEAEDAAGVDEDDALAEAARVGAELVGEAVEGLAGVDGVEEEALGARDLADEAQLGRARLRVAR